jgi:LysM repeat protein
VPVRLSLLGGQLLVTAAGCTNQTTARARATAIPPDFANCKPVLTVQLETYTAQPGDFLSDIAERYEITLDEFAAHTNIVDASLIDVGQLLKIPGTAVVSVEESHLRRDQPAATSSSRRIAGDLQATGLPVTSFHDFRHSAATSMVERCVYLKTI